MATTVSVAHRIFMLQREQRQRRPVPFPVRARVKVQERIAPVLCIELRVRVESR